MIIVVAYSMSDQYNLPEQYDNVIVTSDIPTEFFSTVTQTHHDSSASSQNVERKMVLLIAICYQQSTVSRLTGHGRIPSQKQ